MTDLQAFLDYWVIYRRDEGSHIINGKHEDFYKALENFMQDKGKFNG